MFGNDPFSNVPGYNISKLKGNYDDAWPVSQQDCLSQPDGSVPFSGDSDRLGAMVVTAGRGGRSRLQCGSSAEGHQAAAHSGQVGTVGRRRTGCLPDARLRTGREDSQRNPSAALLLLL